MMNREDQMRHVEKMLPVKNDMKTKNICVSRWAKANCFNINTVHAFLNGRTGYNPGAICREIESALKRDGFMQND